MGSSLCTSPPSILHAVSAIKCMTIGDAVKESRRGVWAKVVMSVGGPALFLSSLAILSGVIVREGNTLSYPSVCLQERKSAPVRYIDLCRPRTLHDRLWETCGASPICTHFFSSAGSEVYAFNLKVARNRAHRGYIKEGKAGGYRGDKPALSGEGPYPLGLCIILIPRIG